MIDEEIIGRYITIDPPKHRFYDQSVEIEKALSPHSEGIYPVELIDTARPNEPTIYKEYRKEVFEPITKTYYDKVLNLLGKIQMADDWSVKWPEPKNTFPKGESPREYIQEKYPDFSSIENWWFSVGLNAMIDDPNAVIAIFPDKLLTVDNEYVKPICHIYESPQVLEFKNNELCVIAIDEIPDTDLYLTSQLPKVENPRVIIFIDQNTVEKFVKIKEGSDEQYVSYYLYQHNTGVFPCLKTGGRIKDYKYGEKLYESFIQSCVPHWNESIRRYSDHQVNMALHLHPDRWEIADQECKVCNGNGTVGNKVTNGVTEKGKACGTCGGLGKISYKTPFSVKMVRMGVKTSASDTQSVPTPPMGYAERPIETIDYLNKEWKSCISQGLSALNMEFLMYEPAVNSGIAKALDRSELNAFIHGVATHIINNDLDPIIFIILVQRYGMTFNKESLMEMMPTIKVPVKFDIILSTVLLEVAKNAKESGIQGSVLDQMYLEYSAKEFGKDSMSYMQLQNRTQLDPLPHMTADEKMLTLSNRGCTVEQYIISSQMDNLLVRAFEENKEFDNLDLKAKRDILMSYAKEVVDNTKNQLVPLFDEPKPSF